MKPQHRESFAALMTGVAELYARAMSPQLIQIYWDGLNEFQFEDVKRAINLHVRNPDTGQFMPKIADVVKFIEGNTLTQAMQAWKKVNDAIREVGTYASVVFDDPLIHAVISDMGGWQPLGLVKDDEWPFKAREFERRYQSYKVKGPQSYPRKLLGIFEQQNIVKGFEVPDPVFIGNQEQAALVYKRADITRLQKVAPITKLIAK